MAKKKAAQKKSSAKGRRKTASVQRQKTAPVQRQRTASIQRMPVTQNDIIKGGVKRPRVTTGKVDTTKTIMARKQEFITTGAGGFGFRQRSAGMMLQNAPLSSYNQTGYLSSYRTSYADGLNQTSGTADIPPYFVMMNQQNGGVLYWPVTLKEKYSWYRYWARSDAYVGRALELLTDLPMSRITLNMPKLEKIGKKKKQQIYDFYRYMVDRIDLFSRLQEMLWEHNMIGNVFAFIEWDDKMEMWSKITILPPEEVDIFQYPFSEIARVEYRPERLIQLIQNYFNGQGYPDLCSDNSIYSEIVEHIPKEIKDMVRKHGCIVMDSDPSTGSYVYHMGRRRSPYLDLGASVLERILVPMLQKEHYRYTQLSLASRNMTPKNKVQAPLLTNDQLDDLRAQLDLSYLDPDYSIVTNYEWDWEQIGAEGRLLDLSAEYENIENQVFAALGVTRELLTGEGTFSGNKITVEILNTMFLITREQLQRFVEKYLFEPVAEKKGWYEEDANGIKQYWYPKLGFNRLTIRDNQEVFDSLFQLYQKGSLPIDIIYELFNLNTEAIHDQIYDDLFTVKDPTFNRAVETMNDAVGAQLGERSNLVEKTAKYLKLELKAAEGEEGMGGGFGGGFGEEPAADEEQIAEEVAEELPEDATDEQIDQAIEEKMSEQAPAEGEGEEAAAEEESKEETPPEEEEESAAEEEKPAEEEVDEETEDVAFS